MNKSRLISEMQKFHFGSRILCTDGDEGYLTHLVMDSETRRLTHIGARQSRLFGKTLVVPYDTVVFASADGVSLSITRAELVAAHDASANGANLDGKSTVENTGAAGKETLMLVAIHPESGELSYIVAHNLRPNMDTLLREEYVKTIGNGVVTVSIDQTTLQELPPYRSDRELQQEVESILFDITPLHIDLPGMTMRVLDGVLYMDGNISSQLRGDIAYDQILGVQGLLEIKNNLVGDDQLANDLAMALGRDPRTRDLPIGVYPRLGAVRLAGAVHTIQQKVAAEEITRKFPSVRSVSNELVVNPKTDIIRVMAPAEGGEAEDKVPGKYVRHTK